MEGAMDLNKMRIISRTQVWVAKDTKTHIRSFNFWIIIKSNSLVLVHVLSGLELVLIQGAAAMAMQC